MIGITQDERGVDVLEMFGRESLDRRLRADRCEDRREEVTVRRGENARAGMLIFGGDLKVKHRANYNPANLIVILEVLLPDPATRQPRAGATALTRQDNVGTK